MISVERIRATMTRYVECVDAGNIEAIIALFAEDAVLEDPVGQPQVCGRAAIEDFYRRSLGTGKVSATLTGPVRTTLNGYGAMAFRVDMFWQGQASTLPVIDVMEFDEQGRIRSMMAYWSPDDILPYG
ncbi:Steroid Delta-isomerase (Delta(5)-3-ketosteroid isomerase) [Pseudomonas chlororaphis subsp. aureofaciens]|uniref:nuclear transport factor 2 family protein n=1 Tax=Pseudomonas chlororaphis TaxID=587753 RepID=UPI000F56C11E|nr:nuclear transport factor 2 family protein [Pseudomonas chlororaphis]AZD86970.1 Steroid Delta-isomerase (Delta(5)-3-ketosteroid isomerase) [Pseudomonas chlororaphis subsp. aureofaciens]